MAAGRYILRFKGAPQDAVKEYRVLENQSDVQIVDHSMAPRSVLIEASAAIVRNIQHLLGNWAVIPEKKYSLPNTRKRI